MRSSDLLVIHHVLNPPNTSDRFCNFRQVVSLVFLSMDPFGLKYCSRINVRRFADVGRSMMGFWAQYVFHV
jgi:hypothetical protein